MAEKQALESIKNSGVSTANGGNWVTMSNALTRAGHSLTLAEKRLVMLAVSKLFSSKPPPPGTCPVTRITADEYAKEYTVDIDTAYRQLKTAGKQLYKRSLTFYEPAHKRKGKPLKPIEVNMNWVGEARYHDGEAWIELHWWHRLLPHLLGIKNNFTQYQLEQASALRSVYSWRLLELLARFVKTGWAEYDIDDFRTAMDAPPSLKSDFAQVKRRIIEPAVKELIEKDGWLIQWRPLKAGRRVAKVRFDFKRDPQMKMF